MTHTRVLFALLCVVGWGSGALAQTAAESACSSCHEQDKKLQGSVHGRLGCATCHPQHSSYPHSAGAAKPSCAQCHAEQAGEHARSVHGQAVKRGEAAPTCAVCHGDAHEMKRARSAEFRKAEPETCGMCHSEIAQQFSASVHGKAVAADVAEAPVCTSCHGEHSIYAAESPASPVNKSHIRETCAQCHANVRLSRRFGLPPDRIVSFDASFHGLASRAGSQTVANCASCHGIHNILPSTDPKSTINVKNLPQTCGHCHPGAGTRFALGTMHVVEGRGEPSPLRWVRQFYLVLIPVLVGYMFLHNFGDWLRKWIRMRWQTRHAATTSGRVPFVRDFRMYGFERIQHALLMVSFVVLVWTGFALKYPDAWWARPLVHWEQYFPVRGTVHRIASVVFILSGAMHAVSLVASKRLREHWKTLWPRRRDIPEILLNTCYNLFLADRRPRLSRHCYIEKFEYWAVAWGAVIMVISGLMLWANNLTLTWLPKLAIDLATSVHFYEAVLATLAIVVWHFYSVIFDPDVYPMETAWLTGLSVKQRPADEPAGEPGAEPQPCAEVEAHDTRAFRK